MKKFIYKSISMLVAVIMLYACKKEATLTTLDQVVFPSASFTASATNIELNASNEDEQLITLNWAKTEYPIQAPVTYSLQFTTPADTLSTTPWGNLFNIEVGEDVFNKTLTGKELNAMATQLGLTPNQANMVVVRVKAFMDREAYSKALTLNIKPFKKITEYPSLYIAGDFQGWDIGNAVKISSYKQSGIYEGYINITGATNEFKLYTVKDWNSQSYGDGGNGQLIVANCACSNFKVPSNGVYNIAVNLNTMTYIFTKVNWGILGDASPGGWDTDTELTFDPATQIWSATADMKATGSFKFRANKAWALDFGINAEGKLVNANHPAYPYDATVQNITVPSTGNYTISLDLSNPGNFTYKLKKN